MKGFLFKITSVFTSFIPVSLLIKLSGKRTFYPFYHIVSDDPPNHIKHLYPIRSRKQFEKDLDFLQRYFIASEFPSKEKKDSFILSFDDGLSEVYHTIAPILKQRNIPAIFFINSGFVDNKELFFKYKISLLIDKLTESTVPEKLKSLLHCKSKKQCIKKIRSLKYKNTDLINTISEILQVDFHLYLKKEKPYMTTAQIKALKEQGFTIGAHGTDHPLFSEISEDEQIRQIKKSIQFVLENFEEKQKLFAFPFTDDGIKDRFFNTVFEENTADHTFGTAGIKDDPFEKNIQRIPTEKYGLSVKMHIKTELLLYILKRMSGKNYVKR